MRTVSFDEEAFLSKIKNVVTSTLEEKLKDQN